MNVITLTLNPAFDVHCAAPGFAAGRENAVRLLSRDAGGKGINISRALSACHVPSTAYVVVGEENGADFCRALTDGGLSYTALTVPGRIRENITLHTEGLGETRISFPGFAVAPTLLAELEQALLPLAAADAVFTLTGSLPQGITAADVQPLLARLQARGARLVIDSRSFALPDLIEARPFLIKPNEDEISLYYDKPIRTLADAAEAADAIREKGIENVMLSLGAMGAALATPRGRYTCRAPSIKPISTIGAGDSSIAGFLAACRAGKPDEDCLRTAIAYGSAACMQEGTLPPTAADVERLLMAI